MHARPLVVALVVAALGCASSSSRPDGPPPSSETAYLVQSLGDETEPMRSLAGSDISTLPSRYPHGAWVPIEAPLLSMQLVTKVQVNGKPALAALDTGAMSTVMSVPMAVRLGVLGEYTPKGQAVKAFDAHGEILEGERLPLGELSIGEHRWVNAQVMVIGNHPDLFLVGADLLQSVDLFIAADEGLVGLFEAGEGPAGEGDRAVTLIVNDRQLQVKAAARATGGDVVAFPLIVDTGASGTTVPAFVGVNAGLPADLSYESKTLAVGGEQRSRGRFVLAPLFLGDERVASGRVLAMGSTMSGGEGAGLLGNDVMMRHHTLVSFVRGKMWLRSLEPRPASRTKGPEGQSCNGEGGAAAPCIKVALRKPDKNVVMPDDAMPDLCLQVDVGAPYAGKTLELAVTALGSDGEELFNGGALRAYLTVAREGEHGCFTLWRQMEKLGLDDGARLSLRWVRTEGIIWPCDPLRTQCLSFTGPLARLEVR